MIQYISKNSNAALASAHMGPLHISTRMGWSSLKAALKKTKLRNSRPKTKPT